MRIIRYSSVALLVLTLAFAESRSVWTGVYTSEQAARGQKAYNAQCVRCHGDALLGGENSPALVDDEFLEKWNGKSVGALVERTRKTMPTDGPGKISQRVCTDIIAYILSANNFPAGGTELPPDAAAQNDILIQAKK